MTTSQENSFLSEIQSGEPIPVAKLAYFRGRLSNRIHALVLEEFARLENEKKITRAELARRIARKPEQITRWLGTPGNWTFDTFSDLLLGMGCEPGFFLINLKQDALPRTDELATLPQFQGFKAAANDPGQRHAPRKGLGTSADQTTATLQPAPTLASASGFR